MRSNFEIIIDDLENLNSLLDDYFVLINENDFSYHKLSESENALRKELIRDMNYITSRLASDIASLKSNSCVSEKQMKKENRNLVDLVGEFSNILLRLKRCEKSDKELKSCFDNLKIIVDEFRRFLDDYIKRSEFKVYNWAQALDIYKNELNNLNL